MPTLCGKLAIKLFFLEHNIFMYFNFQLSYCSTSCKDQAWDQYHKTLCSHVMGGSSQLPLDKLNEAWK